MTCPVLVIATDAIAKLLDPPPAGSTDVNTCAVRDGIDSGRSTSALTDGSLNARVVVSALMPTAKRERMWSVAFEWRRGTQAAYWILA